MPSENEIAERECKKHERRNKEAMKSKKILALLLSAGMIAGSVPASGSLLEGVFGVEAEAQVAPKTKNAEDFVRTIFRLSPKSAR